MVPVVKEFGPDVAVNDSPHSEVAGSLSLPLTHHLLCPWVIPFGAWQKYGLRRNQVTTYHALDPAAWLKRAALGGRVPKLDPAKDTITVRVQESDAPYLAGADASWTDRVLGSLIDAFPDCNLVVLCRYDFQVEEIQGKYGSRCIVPDEVVSGRDLLSATSLFVGMGGTMGAEAALMGVPTISAFQGSLYTDRYLASVGLLERALAPSALVSKARRLITGASRKRHAKKAARVLASMEDPVPKIAGSIRKAAKQA